ncbi:MAG: hypothetical protein EOP06_30995 [Proteobacteria bacterium]|nr:MAG: hypothetical protein EOP06_30995 [Pseudomonadota bacterium]
MIETSFSHYPIGEKVYIIREKSNIASGDVVRYGFINEGLKVYVFYNVRTESGEIVSERSDRVFDKLTAAILAGGTF